MKKNDPSQVVGKKPISPTLKKMQLYETQVFPIERMKAVRATATDLSTIFGLKFTTKQFNEQRTISVTRIA